MEACPTPPWRGLAPLVLVTCYYSADWLVACCLTSASALAFGSLPCLWDEACHPGTCIARSCHKQGLPQPAVNWLEAVGWRHMQITGGGAEHGECAYPLRHRRHVRRAVRGWTVLGEEVVVVGGSV
jgi:hypothetical protein